MNILKRVLVGVLLGLCVAAVGFWLWLSGHYVVPIVMYHKIDETETYKPNLVSSQSFHFQMNYLVKHKYNVVDLDTVVEDIKNHRRMPRKTVVITFDDGTIDNYAVAFPVLKKHHLPATIFLVAGFIDKPGYLTLDQILEMGKSGITFGSHSRTHAYLPQLTYEQQVDEIKNSKAILEDRLKDSVDYLAYPTGGYNDTIKDIIKEAEYKGALTTNRGPHRLNKDVYALKRIRFTDRDIHGFNIWWKLFGCYNYFRKVRNPS